MILPGPGITAKKCLLPFVLLVGLMWVPLPSAAQSGLAVRDTVNETVGLRQETQRQEEAWTLEKNELVQRYHQASTKVKWLQDRVRIQRQRTQAVEARVAELQRRMKEADRLEGSLQDTLQVVLDHLEASVGVSLPFLPTERSVRLQTLNEDLARSDIDPAEKLRRILEALQVETGYGSTVEVYQDQIQVAGQPISADILRLGRVALFWMTPDRKQGGVFDQGTATWVALGNGQQRRIALAMDMATHMRPIELMDLPLGKIQPSLGVAP